jgi:cytohesin
MCALIAPIENVSGRHGSGAALAVLLEHNADPNNGRFPDGQTLIHMAAERGAVTCLQLLLLHGADAGARRPAAEQSHEFPPGYTPIMSAAAAGNPECVRLLCRTEKGLETIDSRSQGGHTALMMSTRPVYHQGKGACPAENLECALVLLENGADPDLYNNMGKTPLMSAAACADMGAICLLVGADDEDWNDEDLDHPRRKANPNLMVQQTPHKGWTPLMLVVNAHADEKVACLDVLLQAKANPNMRCDDSSPTVLHYAIRPHNASLLVPDAVDTVPLLLRYGADVNARSAERGTPLHYLATTCGCKHNLRVMTMLLEAGADPNQADRYGYTPLMAAANARLLECVEVLLKHGAKASRRDRRRGKTAREQCTVRFERSGKDRPVPYVERIVTLLEKAEEAEEKAEEVAEEAAAGKKAQRRTAAGAAGKKRKSQRRM